MNIRDHLFEMHDLAYRNFHSKLIPTVDKDRIIGVRTPKLREFAKELKGTAEAEEFCQCSLIITMRRIICMDSC